MAKRPLSGATCSLYKNLGTPRDPVGSGLCPWVEYDEDDDDGPRSDLW